MPYLIRTGFDTSRINSSSLMGEFRRWARERQLLFEIDIEHCWHVNYPLGPNHLSGGGYTCAAREVRFINPADELRYGEDLQEFLIWNHWGVNDRNTFGGRIPTIWSESLEHDWKPL